MKRLISSSLYGCLAATLCLGSAAVQANPSQFIAKQYTEGLGRAPDAGGWKFYQSVFEANGCNKTMLKEVSLSIFTSAEYAGLGYDNPEKVLTAYRAIFSREPDAGGFNYWLNFLNNGNSVASMIDFMYQGIDGGELTTAKICGSLGYGWGSHLPLDNATIPAKNDNGAKTLAELQAAMQNAQPGSTVYLAQRAVIQVNSPIVVKAGVTLATTGKPSRNQYAKQARLVRKSVYGSANDELASAVVRIESGGRLDSVWVSGQAQVLPYTPVAANVAMHSGTNTTLANARLDNSIGWTSIIAHHYGTPCSSMLVSNNLVAGYTSDHHYMNSTGYTDGISGNCEDVSIVGNHVIDASDIGIIVFAPGGGRTQRSQVRNNVVISAGVPAFGALMLHPEDVPRQGPSTSFTGAALLDNQFWAAPDTHFDLGIVLGGATWDANPSVGVGGTVTGNTNAGVATPMFIGMVIDGMRDVTVRDNVLSRLAPKQSFPDHPMTYPFGCNLRGETMADLTPGRGHATQNGLEQQVQHAAVHTCIGHYGPTR